MSNPHDDYQNELPEIVKIAKEEWVKQMASDAECVGDTERLFRVAEKYHPELTVEGMDETLIFSLPSKKNAFAVAASRYSTAVIGQKNGKGVWSDKKALAYTLRRRLFRYGKFAFEALPAVLAELKEIIEGAGDLDLIHDLLKLNDLYRAHIEAFAPLKKFSTSWLDEALELYNELLDLYGQVNLTKEEKDELERIERQAYTHMYRSVKEIRRWAYFVFADQPEILEEFKVTYYENR